MEQIYITIVALYTLFVAICLLRMKLAKRRKRDIVGKGSPIHEIGSIKTDIVGKSKFEKTGETPLASISAPVPTTSQNNEKTIDNPGKFAPSNEERPSAIVPPEELDEAFSDTTPDEDNEPMDIDYPLEYEDDETNQTDDEEEESEEMEEMEGVAQAALASGVKFEELGNAVWAVNRKNEATAEQKRVAGNTLLEIRRTDLFEQLVSGKPDARETVISLMAESLAAFHRRKDKEAGNTGSGRKAPDTFDIRNFA